jgi:hypothetical protein
MLSQPVRRSACQFVYRRILGAICNTRNNGGPILSPPAREPAIKNVARYGMQNSYMLYKISTRQQEDPKQAEKVSAEEARLGPSNCIAPNS